MKSSNTYAVYTFIGQWPDIDVVIINRGALEERKTLTTVRCRGCVRGYFIGQDEHVDFIKQYLSFRDERVSVQNGR